MNKQSLRRCRGVALALLLAAPASALAASAGLPRYGVAVYSDLCQEPETGDIGGQRITLHRYAEGDSVIYEFTAGGLSLPVVATDVLLDDKTGALTFNVQEVPNGAPRTVIGRFAQRGRTLTLAGGYCADGALPMRLAKVSDFGRALPSCKACPPAPQAEPPADDGAAPAAAPAPDDPQAAPTLEQQEQKEQQQQLEQRRRASPDNGNPAPVTPLAQ